MAKRRKKGEGSVRQRKDGRWEGRVVIGYDEKGLPRTKNVLAKTKRECQEKLKQLRETVTGPRTEKVRPEMPFGEWLDFWYQNYAPACAGANCWPSSGTTWTSRSGP